MDANVASDAVAKVALLVRTDAGAAEREATQLLSATTSERDRAVLHWVVGLAAREAGELARAQSQFDTAMPLAESAGDEALWARIASSSAFVLGQVGELDQAAELLRRAEPLVDGVDHAGVLGQLGLIAYWRGDLALAESTVRECCDAFERFGEREREGRFRGNLGAVLSLLGKFAEAEVELRRAATLAEEAGMASEAGVARANLGYVSTLRGDLTGALAEFSASEAWYHQAGAESLLPRLHADHAQALADAGLLADAEALVAQAADMYRNQGQETELAGVLLTSAAIRLAAGDAEAAVAAADEAEARFVAQDRASWAAVAHSLALQAAARLDDAPGDLADRLDAAADRLAEHRWSSEALRTRLVAAKVRVDRGTVAGVAGDVRAEVDRGRASDQILLAHIDALSALLDGNDDAARSAVDRGLRVATAVQAGLGSIETRAHAAAHGHELVELGARLAVRRSRPRELLARIEATRVMAARLPSVRPPADSDMAHLLAELRSLEAKLTDPDTDVDEREASEALRLGVEREVRRRSRTLRGDGAAADLDGEIAQAIDRLGERQLVAHAALDGRLHAVTVIDGVAALHDLGALDDVRDQVEGVGFSLNRLNRAPGSEASRLAAAEMLFGLADELADLLLPRDVAEAFEPVVIVPTAVLHDVPWGLLPPLGGRPVVINASLTGWSRALASREHTGQLGRAGFVAGPGLEFAQLEVTELASYYPDVATLVGGDASGEHCLELFGSVDLAHVACHGTFRRDNPLFSSLHVADGPLNVYDFERIDQLPDTVVLSACSVAGSKALQGGALLGLATALTTLGAATVIAPLTPISDASAVTVMQRLHQAIAGGVAPADALASATLTHDVADPTAASFVALGA